MRAILLGLLAATLLAGNADAQQPDRASANYRLLSYQQFIRRDRNDAAYFDQGYIALALLQPSFPWNARELHTPHLRSNARGIALQRDANPLMRRVI
jgi:hypothetical protein